MKTTVFNESHIPYIFNVLKSKIDAIHLPLVAAIDQLADEIDVSRTTLYSFYTSKKLTRKTFFKMVDKGWFSLKDLESGHNPNESDDYKRGYEAAMKFIDNEKEKEYRRGLADANVSAIAGNSSALLMKVKQLLELNESRGASNSEAENAKTAAAKSLSRWLKESYALDIELRIK